MNWVEAGKPAVVLAPMDGVTDAAMRSLQGQLGGFSFAVSEFVRVSQGVIPAKVFRRDVPELLTDSRTVSGLPVQVQLLGGDPERMALSAAVACRIGAQAIDINFGCPAPTVNRHDGGATLLQYPCRIRDIVAAVRAAVPAHLPVSAKLRLGWDSTDAIYENAAMAAAGGASWITVHARTKSQGYKPPVYWEPIGEVRRQLAVPVVANGDIWTLDDFERCREVTGCEHFMLGRSSLSNPGLARQIALSLGLQPAPYGLSLEWEELFQGLVEHSKHLADNAAQRTLLRLKQWTRFAQTHGDFAHFHELKLSTTLEEFFERLRQLSGLCVTAA